MKNLILVFIISFMTYGLANSQNTLSGYNQIDDTFFYDNERIIKISANNFIDSLKVKLKSNPNRIISSNINNYEKAALKTKKMNSLYDKGIVHEDGKIIKGEGQGRLCMASSWPGQMRTVYGDHQRFIDTYFSQFDGKYFTGDGCKRDKDGYYWITGRVDDVIIVSGHNLGTAEIESAFVAHPKVAEAAVVGYPHDIKGNGLYCYVTLKAGEAETGELERDLKLWVRKQIGPLATPDLIHFSPGLPKTRSGKIMRRILRKIAANEHDQLGDTTTLADPSVVTSLVENRKNI